MRRVGLDYWPHVDIREHASWAAFLETEKPEQLWLFEPQGNKSIYETEFAKNCYLVFGGEVLGVPKEICDAYPDGLLQIPMRTHLVRSLNLSQSASIVLYEAIRQHGLPPV